VQVEAKHIVGSNRPSSGQAIVAVRLGAGTPIVICVALVCPVPSVTVNRRVRRPAALGTPTTPSVPVVTICVELSFTALHAIPDLVSNK
jgi:hypothetical protein